MLATWVLAREVGPSTRSHDRASGRSGRSASACVVLLSVDSLRPDGLPVYDPSAAGRPHLRELLEDSVVFLEARSPGPWTKTAFASILTGLSPVVHRTTTRDSVLPDRLETLAEALQREGYDTAAIGVNPFLGSSFGFNQGFNTFEFYPRPPSAFSAARLLAGLGLPTPPATEDLAERARDWLLRERGEPFFLWLHFYDPHLPYAPPLEFRPRGRAPERIGYDFDGLSAVRRGTFVPSLEERRWIRALYEAEIDYVDANVGRVVSRMRELDLYDRCLLVFLSDHGEEFWEHGGFEHGHSLYDELLRVPLAFKLPGRSDGRVVREPVSTERVAATILELLELERSDTAIAGASLAPLWNGSRTEGGSPTLSTGVLYYEERVSVTDGAWKYIRELETGREQLFDLRSDPGELRSRVEHRAAERARALIRHRTRQAEAERNALALGDRAVLELDEPIRARLRSLGYAE